MDSSDETSPIVDANPRAQFGYVVKKDLKPEEDFLIPLSLPQNYILVEDNKDEIDFYEDFKIVNDFGPKEAFSKDDLTTEVKPQIRQRVVDQAYDLPTINNEFVIPRETVNPVIIDETVSLSNDRSSFNRKLTQSPLKSPVYVEQPVIIREVVPFTTGQVFNSEIGEVIPAKNLEEHVLQVPSSNSGYSFNGFNYQDR